MNSVVNLEQIEKEVYEELMKKIESKELKPPYGRKGVDIIITLAFYQMKRHLMLHDTLKFVGFGKFMVITKHNLKARSPKTGENAFLPVHTRVVFKSSFFRSWFKDHPVLEDMDAKESKEEPQ